MVRSETADPDSVWRVSEFDNFVLVKDGAILEPANNNNSSNAATGAPPNSGADYLGRRSAISTSELGLYFDRSDRYYNPNFYGTSVKKFVYGIMIVVSTLLLAVFLYDLASTATSNGKYTNQESKHIHILQNALKRGSNSHSSNRSSPISTSMSPDEFLFRKNRRISRILDRSDEGDDFIYENDTLVSSTESSVDPFMRREFNEDEMASRELNLKNYKIRNRIIQRLEQVRADSQRKKTETSLNNHAMVYRVRLKAKVPRDLNTDRASQAQFEISDPYQMTPMLRQKYPQLSQYGHSVYAARSIQDILKYLVSDPQMLKKGIKFSGYYVAPKSDNYNTRSDIPHEIFIHKNMDEQSDQPNNPAGIAFSLEALRPNHPSEINLLATSDAGVDPLPESSISRYHHPYYSNYYARPTNMLQTILANNNNNNNNNINPNKIPIHHDTSPAQTVNGLTAQSAFSPHKNKANSKMRPFSVMLDIYPITDVDPKRMAKPIASFNPPAPLIMNREAERRKPAAPPPPPPPPPSYPHPMIVKKFTRTPPRSGKPKAVAIYDDEKQEMIFHLNLYPKKKNKMTRTEIIQKSQAMTAEERENFMKKMSMPFDTIQDILEDEEQGRSIEDFDEEAVESRHSIFPLQSDSLVVPPNEEAALLVVNVTTQPTTTTLDAVEDHSFDINDIDTIEGFQRFENSLKASNSRNR